MKKSIASMIIAVLSLLAIIFNFAGIVGYFLAAAIKANDKT